MSHIFTVSGQQIESNEPAMLVSDLILHWKAIVSDGNPTPPWVDWTLTGTSNTMFPPGVKVVAADGPFYMSAKRPLFSSPTAKRLWLASGGRVIEDEN